MKCQLFSCDKYKHVLLEISLCIICNDFACNTLHLRGMCNTNLSRPFYDCFLFLIMFSFNHNLERAYSRRLLAGNGLRLIA